MQRLIHAFFRFSTIANHVTCMHTQSRVARIFHKSTHLLKPNSFPNVIKNLLVSAFNAYDYQIATRHFHHMHGFCLQIGTGITKPAQLFIQARSNQQFTKALYTLLICCKSVILNNDFFYFRHFLCNIPKLFNNVFFRTHTRQVSMHRLRINTKIAMIGTPSTSKYLDFGISRCRKKVLAYI